MGAVSLVRSVCDYYYYYYFQAHLVAVHSEAEVQRVSDDQP